MLPFPSHRHSVTGNGRIMMSLSSFQSKILKGGCKKGVLMQYKCMEKEIRKLHGRILLLSVMYIANIPAGMQLWQIGKPRVPVYRFLISLPDFPGPREIGTDSADSKKHDHQTKNTDTIPPSMSPHSRTTSSRRLQDFPVCLALAPDSERPAILFDTDLYPCFCAVPFQTRKKLLIRPMLMRGRASRHLLQ